MSIAELQSAHESNIVAFDTENPQPKLLDGEDYESFWQRSVGWIKLKNKTLERTSKPLRKAVGKWAEAMRTPKEIDYQI